MKAVRQAVYNLNESMRTTYFFVTLLLVPRLASAFTVRELHEGATLILLSSMGFFGAVAFFVFVAGFIFYASNIFLERRKKGIVAMEWGVIILFVVMCLAFFLAWIS